MSSTQFVQIYHPLIGSTITTPVWVALQSVDDHVAHGWLLVDPEATLPDPVTPYYTTAAADSRFAKVDDIDDPETLTGERLRAAFGRYFNVEKYGAEGDGTTDDTAAFQAAANAAQAAGGGTVYAPTATYLIGTSIAWRSKVALIGDGPGRTILKAAVGLTASVIQVGASLANPLTDVAFRDFEIDGSALPTSSNSKGIFITYMKRARFENVYIHHTTATGFGCDFLQDVVFDRCVAENCGRQAIGTETTTAGCSGFGIGTGTSQVESVVVRNCVARNNARYGIFVELQSGIGAFRSLGTVIESNYVDGNYWGIGSCGVEKARIHDNTVVNSVSHAIVIGKSDATHGALSLGDQIINNTLSGNGGRGINLDATDAGLAAPYVGGYKISGNTIRSTTGVAIKIQVAGTLSACLVSDNLLWGNGSLGIDFGGGGVIDSSVVNNLVLDSTGVAIRVLAPMTRVRIAGNKASDTRASGKTQTYGIDIASTVTDCDIRGNDFRGNATAAINRGASAVAASTIIRDNLGDGPAAVDSVTVTASPMTYTTGAGPETLYVIGGTWTSIQVGGQTVLTSPGTVELEPYDVVALTYTAAPTAIKRRRRAGA